MFNHGCSIHEAFNNNMSEHIKKMNQRFDDTCEENKRSHLNRRYTYNNINDKFELLKYEENIQKILSENVSSEILISMTSI